MPNSTIERVCIFFLLILVYICIKKAKCYVRVNGFIVSFLPFLFSVSISWIY